MNLKLKRLCTQCKFFLSEKKTCRINPIYCTGGHKTACKDWRWKFRKDGEYFCKHYKHSVNRKIFCRDCVVRCIRSESRKEIDYVEETKQG